MTTNNRVWIELDITLPNVKGPTAEECKAMNMKRAALATNMIRRLGSKREIYWSEQKVCYCIADSSGSFQEMGDKGHWFNLDFFGRGDDAEAAKAA